VIEERLRADYALLLSHPLIQTVELVRFVANYLDGYLRARCTLSNGDFLEIAMHILVHDGEVIIDDYRYQWMNNDRSRLRRRWDNTPHFAHLENFPHHCHMDQEDRVESSIALDVAGLFLHIEQLLTINHK
jgi:hypothetical protein